MTYPATAIPRFQDPDYFETAPDYCMECDTEYHKDDGEFCNCHCSDCGDELPEVDDSHCQNCCDCDACTEAHDAIEKHHEKTGEWLDSPVIIGEKVYSNR